MWHPPASKQKSNQLTFQQITAAAPWGVTGSVSAYASRPERPSRRFPPGTMCSFQGSLGYSAGMRWSRSTLAFVLAMTLLALPTVLDQCAFSCEAAAAESVASAAACHHHPPSSTSAVGPTPVSCGHDHTGMISVAAAAGVDSSRRALAYAIAVVPPSVLHGPGPVTRRAPRHVESPPASVFRLDLSPLRI